MTEGAAVTDRTDEVLERMAKRTAELDAMTPEEREAYLAKFDEDEQRQRHLAFCAELEKDLIPRRYEHDIALPDDVDRAISAWWNKFWNPDARDDRWNVEGRTGLCFTGIPGAGKSHAAWMLTRRLLRRGFNDLRWIFCQDLFDELRDCAKSKRSDREIVDRATKADLLFLDDLGALELSAFEQTKLLQILDARAREADKLSTIVTTNISAGQMAKFFGARNASRVGGMCEIVPFPEFDHRTGVDYGNQRDEGAEQRAQEKLGGLDR